MEAQTMKLASCRDWAVRSAELRQMIAGLMPVDRRFCDSGVFEALRLSFDRAKESLGSAIWDFPKIGGPNIAP